MVDGSVIVLGMANTFSLPQVGDGATYSVGSDRYPATVIKVTAKSVTIQDDDYHPAPGYDYFASQVHTFTRNANGKVQTARWSAKKSAWTLPGGYSRVGFNGRSAYQNPSF